MKGPRLRVVTLVDGIGVAGGGERLAREVTTRLDPERFERTLCVSRWSDERERRPAVRSALAGLADAQVRFVGLRRRSAVDLPAWRPLVSLLRRERVDVLHSHKFGSNVWGAVLARLAGTPVFVAHEHTWSFEGQPVRRLLDRRLIASRAAAFVAVSTEDRRRMAEIEGIDPSVLEFIPNGIPEPPEPSGSDVRAELGIAPDAPVVGTVCALRPQKALAVLLRAAAQLLPRFPALRVLIAGEGDERHSVEALVLELGLGEAVTLLGFRADVPDLLRTFDVAASSSDFEGTPLSILEYMAAGLPVVATRVGGVPDVVHDGETGLLVPTQDPEALAAGIGRLLTDKALAAEMGRRGAARQQMEFDIAVTVRRTEELYESLCASA